MESNQWQQTWKSNKNESSLLLKPSPNLIQLVNKSNDATVEVNNSPDSDVVQSK